MSSILKYIVDRPLLSHGLLGLAYTALLLAVIHPAAACALVCMLFYGREIGQLNHDLLKDGASPLTAFWRAHVLDLSMWEIAQVLSPAISSAGLCILVANLI